MDNSTYERSQAENDGGFASPLSRVGSRSDGPGSSSRGGGLICAWPSGFSSVYQTRRAIEAALGGSLRECVAGVDAVQYKNYSLRLDIFLRGGSREEEVLAVLKRKRGQLGFLRVKVHEPYHVRKRKEGLPGDWWAGMASQGVATLGICTLNLHGGLAQKKAELAAWAGARQLGVMLLQETTRPSWAGQGQAVIPGFVGNDVATEKGVPGARGVGCWTRKGIESRPSNVTALERHSAYKGLAFRRMRIPGGGNRWMVLGSVYLTNGWRKTSAKGEIRKAVSGLLQSFPDDVVVLGGDFNMSGAQVDNLLVRDWRVPMTRVQLDGSSLTYHCVRVMSSLDHFIVTTRDMDLVSGAAVDRTWDNSDHWPVVLRMKLPLVRGGASPQGSVQQAEGGHGDLDGWTVPGLRARVVLDRRSFAGKSARVAASNRYAALAVQLEDDSDAGDSAALSDESQARDSEQEGIDRQAVEFLDASGDVAKEEGLVVLPRQSKRGGLHFTLDRETRRLITRRHNLAKMMVAEAFNALHGAVPSDDGLGSVDRVSFDARRRARLEEMSSHYKVHSKEVAKRVKECKKSAWLRHVARGASHMVQNDAKRAWRWVKNHLAADQVGGQARSMPPRGAQPVYCTTGQGSSSTPAPKLCVDPFEIASVWTKHYRDLLSDITGHSKLRSAYWGKVAEDMAVPYLESLDCQETEGPISWMEVNNVLRSFSGSKASGLSGFPPDWFKMAQEDPRGVDARSAPSSALGRVLLNFCNRLFSSAHIPRCMRVAEVVNIFKDGDPRVVDNYRGISLIEIPLKVITAVVTRRVSSVLECSGRLSEYQAGFRRDEEAMAHVVALQEMVGRRLICGKTTYLAFIDVKKAFDTVPHGAMLQKLESIGIRGRCHKFFAALYESSVVRVRCDGDHLTGEIPVERGVRQGCPASPLLFNVFINDILKACSGLGIKVLTRSLAVVSGGEGCRRVPGLLFADDLVLTCPSKVALRRALAAITQWADAWELKFNASKCGIMGVGPRGLSVNGGGEEWSLQGVRVPVVSRYKYLGIWFTEHWDYENMLYEHESRVLKTVYGSMNFLRNSSIPMAMRLMVFKGQVLPVASYGGELFGMCVTRSTRTQTLVNKGLKALVQAGQGSHIGSTLPLMLEFGIRSVHSMWSGQRARLLARVRDSKTVVRALVASKVRGSRRGTWSSLSRRWLKVWGPKLAAFGDGVVLNAEGLAAVPPKVLGETVRGFLMEKLLEQKSELVSLRWYIDSDFASTRQYIRDALRLPGLSKGVTLLVRLRTGWGRTAQRWAQMGVGPQEWHGTCPFCGELGVPETMLHLLLQCRRWKEARKTAGLEEARRAVMSLWRSLNPGDGVVFTDEDMVVMLLGGKSSGRGDPSWWLQSRQFYARQRRLGGVSNAEALVDPANELPEADAEEAPPDMRLGRSRKLPCYAVVAGFLMSIEKKRNRLFFAHQPLPLSQSPEGQGSL